MDVSEVFSNFNGGPKVQKKNCLNVSYVKENKTASLSNDKLKTFVKASDIEDFLSIQNMLDEDKEEKLLEEAIKKVKNGEDLTAEELVLLRKKNPLMYAIAMQTKAFKESFKAQLKNCRSKREAQDLMLSQSLSTMGKIQDAKNEGNKLEEIRQTAFLKAMQEVYKEFVKSDEYLKLPEETKEEERYGYKISFVIDLTLETLIGALVKLEENETASEVEAVEEIEDTNIVEEIETTEGIEIKIEYTS